jgi:Tfp pilus assembly protein PilX
MKAHLNFLKNSASTLKNENGVVLVAAILILVLLTIVGVVSTNISNTEIKTAFNEIVYQQNLYRAEGATMEAVELLDGIADPKTSPPSWLEPDLDQITNADINDNAFWQSGLSGTMPQASSSVDDTNFVVVSEGIVSGTSLGMGSSKVHAYSVFGRSAPPNRGATIIEIGYLKAF